MLHTTPLHTHSVGCIGLQTGLVWIDCSASLRSCAVRALSKFNTKLNHSSRRIGQHYRSGRPHIRSDHRQESGRRTDVALRRMQVWMEATAARPEAPDRQHHRFRLHPAVWRPTARRSALTASVPVSVPCGLTGYASNQLNIGPTVVKCLSVAVADYLSKSVQSATDSVADYSE